MRRRRGALRAVACLCVASAGLAIGAARPSAQRDGGPPVDAAAARAANRGLVGTWRLAGRDTRDAAGQVVPAAPKGAEPFGFLVYDPAGYVSAAVATPGASTFAGPQPTLSEARTAMRGYTAYWGSFVVDAAAGRVTHQTFGALDPAVSGTDLVQRFTLLGDRLTLQPPAGADRGQGTLAWTRVPDLPTLTPTQRRLVGFWKLVSWESRNEKGELLSANPGETGFIVYTASGHVLVHMMQPYRRRNAGGAPTPEETMATYKSYTGYVGTFTVDDAQQYVVHHIDGTMNSGPVGTNYQRFLEFSGKRLVLRPPVTKNARGEVHIALTWERISD